MGIEIMSLKEWYLVPSARMGSRMGPFWGQNGVNSGIPEVAGPDPEGSNPGFRGSGSGFRGPDPEMSHFGSPKTPLLSPLFWGGMGGPEEASEWGPF